MRKEGLRLSLWTEGFTLAPGGPMDKTPLAGVKRLGSQAALEMAQLPPIWGASALVSLLFPGHSAESFNLFGILHAQLHKRAHTSICA